MSNSIDQNFTKELAEDEEDIRVFEERANEPTLPFEEVFEELKANGRL